VLVERTWRSRPRDVRRLEAGRLLLGFPNPSFSLNFGSEIGPYNVDMMLTEKFTGEKVFLALKEMGPRKRGVIGSYEISFERRFDKRGQENTSRVWKVEVIKDNFSDVDVARILQILLANEGHDDMLLWRKSLLGNSRCEWQIHCVPDVGDVESLDHVFCECPVSLEFRSRSGVVVRNDRGKVLASKFVFHKDVASSFAVEALACSQAVQLGESMGLAILVIEGDALTIIKKCQLKDSNKSKIRGIVLEYVVRSMGTGKQKARELD
ncbi:hypothetical protein Gotri_018893, partial [Gossypium trilobum]|nr:hypothetical protein [Gossypium trilobum]